MAVNCHALQIAVKRFWERGVFSLKSNRSAIKIRKEKEIK